MIPKRRDDVSHPRLWRLDDEVSHPDQGLGASIRALVRTRAQRWAKFGLVECALGSKLDEPYLKKALSLWKINESLKAS